MIYKLKPILKHRLWGGSKIPQIFNVNTNDQIGEAWILSCINNDNNYLDNGKTLKDIFLENKNIVKKGYKGDFPILIKLIDAQKDLSIQVHPSVKTEFWHILNNKPSKLFMGLNKNVSKDEIKNALNNSSIISLLNSVDVANGDSYLIKPGTIHAIGQKTFLIEIQQSADVTYRLYDYNRLDNNGKPRQLHINESLNCLDTKKLDISKNNSTDHLVSCPFFNVYKYKINGHKSLCANEDSFNAITIISGNGVIKNKTQTLNLNTFETAFIPAGEGQYEFTGDAIVILTTL